MAFPAPGSYFFRWANGVSGNTSPGTLTVTNTTPGVSALFSTLTANQVSLTPLVDGAGVVLLLPAMNVFTNGQSVALVALADAGQIFLGWTGDAFGVTNPMTLLMDGSKTLTAKFGPSVEFRPDQSQFGSNGFLLSIKSEAGFVFGLQTSADLLEWIPVATLTNPSGSLLYLHADATNWPTLFYRAAAP